MAPLTASTLTGLFSMFSSRRNSGENRHAALTVHLGFRAEFLGGEQYPLGRLGVLAEIGEQFLFSIQIGMGYTVAMCRSGTGHKQFFLGQTRQVPLEPFGQLEAAFFIEAGRVYAERWCYRYRALRYFFRHV